VLTYANVIGGTEIVGFSTNLAGCFNLIAVSVTLVLG
jgi:hypothetical protein